MGYYVLQFDNEADTVSSAKALRAKGYEVNEESAFGLCDISLNASEVQASEYINNYAYINSGALFAKNYINAQNAQYDTIVVGVIDTGLDYNNELFRERWVGEGVNFTSEGTSNNPMDYHLHGTACASIIVNSTPENVKVKPYKVIDSSGSCTLSELIAAMEYILAEQNKPDVLNISIGGYDIEENNSLFHNLLREIISEGIPVCVAAGNETAPADYGQLTSVEEVITVAALTGSNAIADYSDYGNVIDVAAPGSNVHCAVLNNKYTTEHSGTSFAAPFVSAACAYVIMLHPNYTAAQIENCIKNNAIYAGQDNEFYYGAGILSIHNIVVNTDYTLPLPSVSSGTYHNEQLISFNVPQNTTLIYTTDMHLPNPYDMPNLNTKIYSEPIAVTEDTLIIYALIQDGDFVSRISSLHYEIQYYADESDFTVENGVITAYNGNRMNIIVPSTINGVTVSGVGNEAFREMNITGIVFPDSVTYLEAMAFAHAQKLRHITARGVTQFKGESVFLNCFELRNEQMPLLNNITSSAFRNCKKLTSVDFGENLSSLANEAFYNAGLLSVNMPNVELNDNSCRSVFYNCPLRCVNLPGASVISTEMFYGCSYIVELITDTITKVYDKSLSYCRFVNDLDLTYVNDIYNNSFYQCHIKQIVCPLVTAFPAKLGDFCFADTISFPNATGNLETKFLNYCTAEKLFLPGATSTSSKAFTNTIKLSYVFMPSTNNFYAPISSKAFGDDLLYGDAWTRKAPLKCLWIPNATSVGTSGSNLYLNETELIFAPSAITARIIICNDSANTVMVLSEEFSSFDYFQFDENAENGKVRIVAPENSYAKSYARINILDFTPVGQCRYNSADNGFISYSDNFGSFSVPVVFVDGYWSTDYINNATENTKYLFVFDFTNDNFINAKDFSVYRKITV
jgi:hypothetical protein